MTKPDLKGLTKLAQVIKTVPHKEFDMDTWWKKTPCGSSGCILGWAAMVFPSRFRKVSLGKRINEYKEHDIEYRKTGNTREAAFADAFGTTIEDAKDIIYSPFIYTPKEASRALTKLVKQLQQKVE